MHRHDAESSTRVYQTVFMLTMQGTSTASTSTRLCVPQALGAVGLVLRAMFLGQL